MKEKVKKLLKLLDERMIARADGVHMICECGNEKCPNFYLSRGDTVFTVSYAFIDEFKQLQKELIAAD